MSVVRIAVIDRELLSEAAAPAGAIFPEWPPVISGNIARQPNFS
jgi:hypothetical protein